jgi:hypothetical protein
MRSTTLSPVLLALLCGCSFVGDLLHMEAVEVEAWSPDRELVAAEHVPGVSVTFTSSMNRALAEDAFSLSRGNDRLQGRFSWEVGDETMIFTPEIPLSNGHRYTIRVTELAEDRFGNSLAEPFLFEFATAEELLSPEILYYEPADGAQEVAPREAIHIVFSEPIEEASFYRGFSVFPSVHGAFLWNAAGAEVRFRPLADYQPGQDYEVVLESDICDRSGNRLAEEFRFVFTAGQDTQASLLSVQTLAGGRQLIPVQSGGGIDPSLEIEKDERFLLTFTRAPSEQQKIDLLRVDPTTPFTLTWEEQDCLLGFDELLSWNRIYQIELAEQTYIFVVNGPRSIPISVAAVSYCPDLAAPDGDEKFVPLSFADNVDFSNAAAPAFDIHLLHAEGVQVDLGSFLLALDITVARGCISLAVKDVELSPLAVDPYPLPEAGQSVVRLHCDLVEDPGISGTITLRIGTALRDSADNHLSEDFVLLINN